MKGWTIAVFIVQLVTAGLFIWAILATRCTTKAVENTTSELMGVESGIKESVASLERVRESIVEQTEVLFLAQLRIKWSSPEISASRQLLDAWNFRDETQVKRFLDECAIKLDLLYTALEIPRFFNILAIELKAEGHIPIDKLINNFGLEAVDYWDRCEPLIDALNKNFGFELQTFAGFADLAGTARNRFGLES